jgi:hypothetical protein
VAVEARPRGLDPEQLRAHVAYLADDAQEGRAPGSPGDERAGAFVADAMAAAGLLPAGPDGFRQPFSVQDGVRLRPGAQSRLAVGDAELAHELLPFGRDTSPGGPVPGRLVFVGHGIAGSDDLARARGRLRGNIAVALAGGPHGSDVPASALRPQAKLIAVRDHGAVGLVLWDPVDDRPPPNSGRVDDLAIPAVFVGRAATPGLLEALAPGAKSIESLRPGRRSRERAQLHTPVEPVVLATANVLGRVPGRGGTTQQVIVGAHLDHLGRGRPGSLAPDEDAVHNGADDNASGVATMLGIAAAWAERPVAERGRDLLFVAFGAEEMGLLGSRHFVERLPAEERARTVAMINLDMVGRLRDELMVHGTGTAKEWPDLIAAVADPSLRLALVPDGYGPSDHASFYEAGIPVLHLWTGAHEDYHRPGDDVDKLDFGGAARIGDLVLGLLERLQPPELALTYVELERPPATRSGFRVSLGTMPDYGASVDGLRLAGVAKGGAAEKAGLRKGDVVVRIDAREIHNLQDYMAAFGDLLPGKPAVVVVMRDERRVELSVVPTAPRPH